MPSRILKQIIYGALFVSFWALVIYAGWNIFYQPTCFDRIKNQGEEQVDCGGPCAPCEIKTLGQPIVLRTVWLQDSVTGKIDFGAEVKNPNASWGAKEFVYTFTALDTSGRVSAKIDGQGFILPGDRIWIIEPAQSVIGRIADVKFEIPRDSIMWQKLKPFAQDVKLPTRSVSFRKILPPEIGFAEIRGEFVNQSSFVLDAVEAYGVVFGSQKEVIAVGKTIAKTIRAGENRHFVIKWQNPFEGKSTRWEAGAVSNFLADQNFIQRYGE